MYEVYIYTCMTETDGRIGAQAQWTHKDTVVPDWVHGIVTVIVLRDNCVQRTHVLYNFTTGSTFTSFLFVRQA